MPCKIVDLSARSRHIREEDVGRYEKRPLHGMDEEEVTNPGGA